MKLFLNDPNLPLYLSGLADTEIKIKYHHFMISRMKSVLVEIFAQCLKQRNYERQENFFRSISWCFFTDHHLKARKPVYVNLGDDEIKQCDLETYRAKKFEATWRSQLKPGDWIDFLDTGLFCLR